jgi:hypothetical protein
VNESVCVQRERGREGERERGREGERERGREGERERGREIPLSMKISLSVFPGLYL